MKESLMFTRLVETFEAEEQGHKEPLLDKGLHIFERNLKRDFLD